jgi:CHAT domain-containing protein
MLLSLAYARLGQPQQSNEELRKAKQSSEAAHSLLEGEVLRTQGVIERRSGQQANAEKSFRKSLDFAREHGDSFLEASDLQNLGAVALQAEHIDEALDRFNSSAQIAAAIHANVVLEAGLGNAGWAYYSLGDFEKALASFQQAEKEARNLGVTDNQILWLQGAGLSLYRLGDLKQAQSSYEEALRAAQASQDTVRKATSNNSLGELFLQLDQLDAAKGCADEALNAARQIGDKSNELEALLLQGLIAARQSRDSEAEQMCAPVYRDPAGMPSLRWETENAFADLYASRHQNDQADVWHRKSIATFEAQRASVQNEENKLPFFANGDALYRDYADFLITTQRSDEALQLLDGARARILKEGLGGRWQSQRKTQYSLVGRGLKAIVLFYSLGPQRSYLWAIDGSGSHLFVLPAEAEIAARVKSYQASILKSRDPLRESNPDAQWLYTTLVGPAEPLIPKDSRVFVVPSGSLNGFNMETLLKPGPQGLHYWIEDVSLTTASSIQLLSRISPPEEASSAGKLLLIGDALTARSEYAALSNAPAEVQDVQQYFPAENRTILTQGAAVPAAYAENHPEQYAYIHFVAHGMASSLRPLDSAIVLSPSSTDRDNFKLYARDIVHRPLHARLVTISACYGSGLRNYAGEGLVGLSWAFLRAGAHQVIGAMWEVNDSSTPQLMDRLYGGLAKGAEPDRALREAKLSLLHSDGVYRKPLYWGAFQLYAGS